MRCLSDLLQAIDQASSTSVSELLKQKEDLTKGGHRLVLKDIGDITGDILSGIEDFHLPLAKEAFETLSRGASYLVIFAFLERALRYICEDQTRDQDAVRRFVRHRSGSGKIEGTSISYTTRWVSSSMCRVNSSLCWAGSDDSEMRSLTVSGTQSFSWGVKSMSRNTQRNYGVTNQY